MIQRKALTRTEIILLCQRQAQGPILCGCGCGVPLDPVGEQVIDEHVLPRRLTETGCEDERDVLENRAFLRKPCAMEKTKADLARIAKARAMGGETGQRARRERRGKGSIPSRPNAWPKGRKLPTKKALKSGTGSVGMEVRKRRNAHNKIQSEQTNG